MADYCQQCSVEIFGKDFGELANLGPAEKLGPGEGWAALCEGCGYTVVNMEGRCMANWCEQHGKEKGNVSTDQERSPG